VTGENLEAWAESRSPFLDYGSLGRFMSAKPFIPRLSIRKGENSFPLPDPITPPDVQTWLGPDGGIFSHCSIAEGAFRIDLPMGVSFFFNLEGNEVSAVPSSPVPHPWLLDAYRRCVLPMVLQAQGMELLHASAILASDGVYAFCANSGTGKSTLAFALGQRGYEPWADDALGMTVSPPRAGIECHQLPFDIRLWKDSREAFASALPNSPSRRQFDTNHTGNRESPPLKAIFLLRRESEMKDRNYVLLKRLSIREAFSQLLYHAYCFSLRDMRRKKTMIENYLFLSSRVPVFGLKYRGGFEYLPQVLDQLKPCLEEIESYANA
jgi:hypothetical protein